MRVVTGATAITATLLLAICRPAPPYDPGAGGGAVLAPAIAASGDEPGMDSPAAESRTRPAGSDTPAGQTNAAKDLGDALTADIDSEVAGDEAEGERAGDDSERAGDDSEKAGDDSERAGDDSGKAEEGADAGRQPIGTMRDWLAAYAGSGDMQSNQPPQLGVLADLPGLPRASLVYVRSGQLIRVDLPGGEERLLTQGPFASFAPQWTDDGRQLFFQSNRTDGVDRVWRVAHDGSQPRRVTKSLPQDPVWTASGDGKHVAYLRRIETNSEINSELHVVKVATGADEVVHRGISVSYPRFSRDGERLFFVQGPEGISPMPGLTPQRKLSVVKLAGGEVSQLPSLGHSVIVSPWDMGDGRLIFGASWDFSMGGRSPEIFTMPDGGGGWTRLNDFIMPAGYLNPLPSPDKQKLAIAWSQRRGGFGGNWWTDVSVLPALDAKAARARRMTSGFPRPFYSAHSPSWAPDSRHLAMSLTLCAYSDCEPTINSVVLLDTDAPEPKAVFVGYGSAATFAPVVPPSAPSIPQLP